MAQPWLLATVGILLLFSFYSIWASEEIRRLKDEAGKRTAQVYECQDVVFDLLRVADQVRRAKIGDKDDQIVMERIVDKGNRALHPLKSSGFIAFGGTYREEAEKWSSTTRSRRGSVTSAGKKANPRRKQKPRKGSRPK